MSDQPGGAPTDLRQAALADAVRKLLDRARAGEPVDAAILQRALKGLEDAPWAEALRAEAEEALAKLRKDAQDAGADGGKDRAGDGDEEAGTILSRIAALPEQPDPDEVAAIIEDLGAVVSLRGEVPYTAAIHALARRLGTSRPQVRKEVLDAARRHKAAQDAAAAAAAQDGPARVADVLGGQAPPDMPPGLVLPRPYALRARRPPGQEDGPPDWETVAELPDLTRPVLPAAMIPIARRHDPDADSWELTLAVRRNGTWKTIEAERSVLADSRKILQLADQDVPVTSESAKAVIRYLAEMEQANLHTIPEGVVVRSLGWRTLGDGRRCFILGRRTLTADPPGTEGAGPPITVRAPGAGERRLLEGFSDGGTLDGWRDGLYRRILPYPRIRIGVYASLASPLLPLIDAGGFTVHYSGLTSTGKTTAMQVAASVWGYPGGPGLETKPGLIAGWDATAVANEQRAVFLRHLPMYLDDSGLVQGQSKQQQDVVKNTVYAVANGTGRRRGDRSGGTRATGEWALTMISTGERSVLSDPAAGGAQVRVVELAGNVLAPVEAGGAAADEAAPNAGSATELMRELRRLAGEHHGVVAAPYIRALILIDRIELQQRFAKALRAVADAAGDAARTDMGSRLAGAFAVMEVAAEILHEVLGMDDEIPPSALRADLGRWFAAYLGANPPEHVDLRAYQALVEWIDGHANLFVGGPGAPEGPTPPPGPIGWAGRWEVAVVGKPCVAIYPHVARRVLEEMHFEDPDSIARQLAARGLLLRDAQGKLTRLVKIGSGSDARVTRCFVLVRRQEQMDEGAEDDDASGHADSEPELF
ncbi:MAG: DUF927 domain-containing protein [Bacillota bacterium]|nr:DUF927 domain-containing protein [Bacillota bacterium]